MKFKTKFLSLAVILLIGFTSGFLAGMFGFRGEPTRVFTDSGCIITSLEDGQEVHSKVVIDATTWGASKVEVLVNDVVIANYLPFVWDNWYEPVGEYNITVRIYGDNETVISEDSKIVVIQEEFIVPENYVFTEDFIIHEGQTVTFEDGEWFIGNSNYGTGMTPSNEIRPYAINVYGTLILKNANITSGAFTVENNGVLKVLESSNIDVTVMQDIDVGEGTYLLDFRGVRLDDQSLVVFDSSSFSVNVGSLATIISKGDMQFCIIEDAVYLFT